MDTNFARNNNETTPNWLERLIALNAPAHIISAVQTLLQNEAQSAGGGPTAGATAGGGSAGSMEPRIKKSVTFTEHQKEVQAKLDEIMDDPDDEKECIFYKFQFNQRGGRMAAYEWAQQFHFHGKVRRIGRNLVYVLAVFEEDETVYDRLKALKTVARNLPEYHKLKTGFSKSYAEYLARPFKVIKTPTRHIDPSVGGSDEPDNDCESEASTVSGGSSFIGGW